MKKTLTTLTLIILAGAMLLSLAGCGAMFNGEKQLTADKLVSTGDNDEKITLSSVYYLDYNSTSTNEIYTLLSGVPSSYYLYLIELTKSGQDLNYSTDIELSTDHRYEGFSYFRYRSDNPQSYAFISDAYMLGTRYYSYDSGFTAVSNVILKEDIILISANNRASWANAQDTVFSSDSYTYGYIKGYKPSGYGYSSSYSSTYKYLWVKLNDSCWVCMGDVSGAQ